jgi:hypothetical protein
MNFTHYDLGFQPSGTVVTVTLSGTEANVRLLDELNFRSYQRDDAHHYVGGHYRRSPAVLHVPTDGRWHVAVDLGGAAGNVTSSVQVRHPLGRSA